MEQRWWDGTEKKRGRDTFAQPSSMHAQVLSTAENDEGDESKSNKKRRKERREEKENKKGAS